LAHRLAAKRYVGDPSAIPKRFADMTSWRLFGHLGTAPRWRFTVKRPNYIKKPYPADFWIDCDVELQTLMLRAAKLNLSDVDADKGKAVEAFVKDLLERAKKAGPGPRRVGVLRIAEKLSTALGMDALSKQVQATMKEYGFKKD
jgi:hypothetical protein